MTLTLHNTSEWSLEQVKRLNWPLVLASMKLWIDRFPHDATVESVMRDVMRGAARLWLVQDEEDVTVASVIVTLTTIEATGWKRAIVIGYGGTRGVEALPLIEQIEEWALQNGADEMEVVGRAGWRRLLGGRGYREEAVILHKPLRAEYNG